MKGKIKLTKDEIIILRNVQEKYRYIERRNQGDLALTTEAMEGRNGIPTSYSVDFSIFKYKLFDWITEGNRYDIKEILGEEK